MSKHYSPTLKAQSVLEMRQETRPVTAIAAAYGIASRLLHRWRREGVDHLPDWLADSATTAQAVQAQEAKIQEPYAPIGKLTTQLAWLKKIWPRP
jgi:putative transposase